MTEISASWLYVLGVRALRALMGLTGPAHPLVLPPPCPQPRTLFQHPWGCQSLPQRCHSRAGLWHPTALPCLSMGPTKPSPFLWPSQGCVPSLVPLIGPDPGPHPWADVRAAGHTDSVWHQRLLLLSCLHPCLVVLSTRKPMALI